MSAMDERPFPVVALFAAGCLMFCTVAEIGIYQARKHAAPPIAPPAVTALETRELRFVDMGDGINAFAGHVQVFDETTGAELPQLRESDGFIRAILNSLNYERFRRDITAPPVFKLSEFPGNRVTMADPSTGAEINIGSFGPGNKVVFMRFFQNVASAK